MNASPAVARRRPTDRRRKESRTTKVFRTPDYDVVLDGERLDVVRRADGAAILSAPLPRDAKLVDALASAIRAFKAALKRDAEGAESAFESAPKKRRTTKRKERKSDDAPTAPLAEAGDETESNE